ncbi:MAG: hypothetical protein JSV22_03465, partial [Bacteroidales bacterium]
ICCLVVFILLSCEKKDDSIVKEKYFDPQNIDSLALTSIDGFWDTTDTNINISVSHLFAGYDSNLIAGRRYSGNEKGIVVSVFSTEEKAINAFELRIENVACVILTYEQAENIQGKWWYSECIPNIVFVNRWNTIIEVFRYHVDYEEVENVLYDTAKEIMKRIDSLSTEIV